MVLSGEKRHAMVAKALTHAGWVDAREDTLFGARRYEELPGFPDEVVRTELLFDQVGWGAKVGAPREASGHHTSRHSHDQDDYGAMQPALPMEPAA